ncbi:hypothetical protein Tco_0419879, partial [Tanacetum coccineum]
MVSDASNNLYDGNHVPGAFVNHYNQFLRAECANIPLDDHDLFTRVLDDANADFMVHMSLMMRSRVSSFLWGMTGLLALTVLLLRSLRKHEMWWVAILLGGSGLFLQ